MPWMLKTKVTFSLFLVLVRLRMLVLVEDDVWFDGRVATA